MDYYKNKFKIIRKDDLYKIIDMNPNMVYVDNDIEDNNGKRTVSFYLTRPKMLRQYGSSCCKCGIEGIYFIMYKNGDIKLIAINNIGSELEITFYNRKPHCTRCKEFKCRRIK
jgi:hypothetical protein